MFISKNHYSLCEAYSKAKGGYVELFPKNYSWDIKRGNQYLASGNSTVTPINVKSKIVNGEVKQTVLSNQEIHTSTRYTSDKGFGNIIENKDVLLNSQNKLMAIYQRPNTYYPASQASLGKDLSKGPVWGNPAGYKTKYTGQTPIKTLNNDLNAGFKSQVNPIWSKLEEMFWHIS